MSCLSCPCHLKWPMDSVGTKRDPINCEKAWLDFAVRLLSREAVGKGRGQETVWGAKCKPTWWDRVVRHPWKNPTANPKDTKEILLEKYLALESHLRDENRFPSELEEESRLWKEGRYRELFLMTSLTSLLGKVTSVHSAIEDACVKVNELKATVHHSILSNIQNCLKSSLKRTEELSNVKSNTNSNRIDVKATSKKRKYSDLHKENVECPPLKQKKVEHDQAQTIPVSSSCKHNLTECIENPDMQPTDILAFAQKLIAKRKIQSPNPSVNRHNNKTSAYSYRSLLPKVATQTKSQPSATSHIAQLGAALQVPNKKLILEDTASNNSQQTSQTPLNNPVSVSLTPACTLTVTPEQLGYLLSQNTLQQISGAESTLNVDKSSKASDLCLQSVQNGVFEQTNYDGLEINEELTGGSANINEKADNFRIDPHHFESENTSNCTSSVFPSESNDIDLSFLNDIDVEELCGELFKESQSSNSTDSTHFSSTDQMKYQNLLDTISEEDIEDRPCLNLDCRVEENENQVQSLLEDPSNLAPGFTDLFSLADPPSKVSSRLVSPTSSLDIGYCSEGSPCGSTGNNSMQQVADLDPFLLDEILLC